MTTPMPQNHDDRGDWPEWLKPIADEYHGYDGDGIRDELSKLMALTRENLTRMAVLVRIADERGESLGAIEHLSMLHALRKIAHGQLLPDIAAKLIASKTVFGRVSNLPLNEQRRVAEDKPLPIAEQQDGEWTHRLVKPSAMTVEEARQVFADDHVRDVGEQRSLVSGRAARAETTRSRKQAGPYVIDGRRKLVKFTKPCELTLADLSELVGRLRGAK